MEKNLMQLIDVAMKAKAVVKAAEAAAEIATKALEEALKKNGAWDSREMIKTGAGKISFGARKTMVLDVPKLIKLVTAGDADWRALMRIAGFKPAELKPIIGEHAYSKLAIEEASIYMTLTPSDDTKAIMADLIPFAKKA